MQAAQHETLNNLLDALNNATNENENQKLASFALYNVGLSNNLQTSVNTGASALHFANNRRDYIDVVLEKGSAIHNAILTVYGRLTSTICPAVTRQQAVVPLGGQLNNDDVLLIAALPIVNELFLESNNLVNQLRQSAVLAQNRINQIQVSLNEIIDTVAQINVPILAQNYGLNDINRSHFGIGYQRVLLRVNNNLQNVNERVFEIKHAAEIIDDEHMIVRLTNILNELVQRAMLLGIN